MAACNPTPAARARAASFALLACLPAILATCGPEQPSPAPELTAEQVRDRAANAMRGLSSAHFVVGHQEGGTDLGFGMLTKAEGDGLFPDRAVFLATAVAQQFGGITLEFDIVQHGGDTYLKDRISNRWQTLAPDVLLISFAGVNDAIADAIAAIDRPALSGSEADGGGETLLLVGAVDAVALAGLVPSAPAGSILDLQVWVGREDFLVRRVEMTGVLFDADPPSMTRYLELSEFDKPLTIEPPTLE